MGKSNVGSGTSSRRRIDVCAFEDSRHRAILVDVGLKCPVAGRVLDGVAGFPLPGVTGSVALRVQHTNDHPHPREGHALGNHALGEPTDQFLDSCDVRAFGQQPLNERIVQAGLGSNRRGTLSHPAPTWPLLSGRT